MKTLKDLKTKLMKNDEFKKIYESKKPLIDFVNDLIELRHKKGWTQQDLAKAVGTAKSNISRIEKGKQNISYEMMRKLTEALGGKLFITAQGNKTVKLTEKSKSAIDEIVKLTGKTPEKIIEAALLLYKDSISKPVSSEEIMSKI